MFRKDLHKDVIKGSEILEVLHQIPEVGIYKIYKGCGVGSPPGPLPTSRLLNYNVNYFNEPHVFCLLQEETNY